MVLKEIHYSMNNRKIDEQRTQCQIIQTYLRARLR